MLKHLEDMDQNKDMTFLRNAIIENDFKGLGIEADEIFVSDGAKCDCGNIVDIFARKIRLQ